MEVVGDVKCYHCGHISGQIQGTRGDRLVLRAFKPRPGYKGPVPELGQTIRCDRCGGPVFLDDMQPLPPSVEPIPLPASRTSKKQGRSSSPKAA